MTASTVTFPSEQQIFAYLSAHSFSQDADAAKISGILAQAFANQTCSQEQVADKFAATCITNQVQLPECSIEKLVFIRSAISALQMCAQSVK